MQINLKTAISVLKNVCINFIEIKKKINRLKNLVLLNKKNYLESTESIEDSYKDLVNYNIIAQLVSRDKWVK